MYLVGFPVNTKSGGMRFLKLLRFDNVQSGTTLVE